MFEKSHSSKMYKLEIVLVIALAALVASSLAQEDLSEVLKDPNFLAFFDAFQKRQQENQQLNVQDQDQVAFEQVGTTEYPVLDHTTKRSHKRRPKPVVKSPQVESFGSFDGFVQDSRKNIPHIQQKQPQSVNFETRNNFQQKQFVEQPIPQQTIPARSIKPHKSSSLQQQQKITSVPPQKVLSKFDEAIFKKQAESAKYEFASESEDSINENFHQRQEVRDGLTVRGAYSFADGYFKRTVHYEADDKGFRIVKEESEPIGNGPQYNPDGQAKVQTYVDGNVNNYKITVKDIQERPTIHKEFEYEEEDQ